MFDWLKRRVATESDGTGLGIRGAGESSQATFGEPINIQDLLFAVEREPVAHRVVFTVAHDIFDNWLDAEEVADTPNENFDDQGQVALSALNAKSVFTEMAIFERLYGWAIILIGYVDHAETLADPVETPS